MKFRLMLSILLILTATFCFAFQWPVENPVLTATFGENRENHFHGGIDIGGGEQKIHPIEEGEVIFYFDLEQPRQEIPTGLGNFLVVEHPRGIRSLYAHLKDGSLDPDKVEVVADDVIGVIGDSGGSYGKHLHLEVADKELRQIVNPMRLLPELADRVVPSINNVWFLAGDFSEALADEIPSSARYEPVDGKEIIPGVWTVILDVYDLSEHVTYFCPMAPYRVQTFLNGQLSLSLVYDGLGEKNDRLEFIQEKGVSFDNYYLDSWLVNLGAINVPEGAVVIEIVASDFAGNESSRLFSLTAIRP
jgi:hypothetical protein